MAQDQFQGKTHIAVILDKSGSMGVVQRETIDGFNSWLKSMQAQPGEASLTLTLFDTQFSTPVKAAPLAKVNPLNDTRYRPSGNTALLDAVGSTLKELGDGVKGDRYIVCIMTDGEENSSRLYTKEDIAGLIAAREKLGNWTFTYLSAGLNAFHDAQSIGVSVGNTQSYRADAFGTQQAFMSNAVNLGGLRSSAKSATNMFYGGVRSADVRDAGGSGIDPGTVKQDFADQLRQLQQQVHPPTAGGSDDWVSGITETNQDWVTQ